MVREDWAPNHRKEGRKKRIKKNFKKQLTEGDEGSIILEHASSEAGRPGDSESGAGKVPKKSC